MVKTLRLIIIAFAGLALAGTQYPSKQPSGGGSAKKEQAAPTDTSPPSPLPEPTYSPYNGYNPDPCYNAKNHDSADLCAQWRAALAAEKAAHESRRATNWSIAATAFSAITIIGLIITLCQANKALGEARRGNRLNLLFEKRSRTESRRSAIEQAEALAIAARNADSAQNLVEISKDNAKRQLRAYITLQEVDFKPSGIIAGPFILQIIWKNTGNTPAVDVVCRTKFQIFEIESELEFDNFDRFPIIGPAARGPNQEIWGGEITISSDNYSSVGRGEQRMAIIGYVAYQDVFGTSHETRTCVEIMISNEPGRVAFVPFGYNNGMSGLSDHIASNESHS